MSSAPAPRRAPVASASTTSARPPVLAQGSHSADSIATRIGGIYRRPPSGVERSRTPRLNRFIPRRRAIIPPHGSRPSPVGRGGVVPACRRASKGLRRLAYNMHWAWHPRTRGLWSLIDRHAWNRYRNPVPVISGPTEWSRLLDDAKFLTEYHDVLAAFDAVHGERLGPLVPAQVRGQPRRARSPTSAPSTASTSRSGSTRAASASSPATT